MKYLSTSEVRALADEVDKLAPVRAAPRPEDITPPEAVRLFAESNVVRAMPRRVSETLRNLVKDRNEAIEVLRLLKEREEKVELELTQCRIELERKCKLRFWEKRKK